MLATMKAASEDSTQTDGGTASQIKPAANSK
jgi:hypothetical protein